MAKVFVLGIEVFASHPTSIISKVQTEPNHMFNILTIGARSNGENHSSTSDQAELIAQ
jgi:hypothetical protein